MLIDLLTEQSRAIGDSPEHGIKKGDPWLPHWCCENENSVWLEGEEKPCRVCPNQKFDLTLFNRIAFERWQQLDQTGRKDQTEYLSENAIDANLGRYKVNSPDIYERVLQIDKAVTENRIEEIKRQEKRKNGKRNRH